MPLKYRNLASTRHRGQIEIARGSWARNHESQGVAPDEGQTVCRWAEGCEQFEQISALRLRDHLRTHSGAICFSTDTRLASGHVPPRANKSRYVWTDETTGVPSPVGEANRGNTAASNGNRPEDLGQRVA